MARWSLLLGVLAFSCSWRSELAGLLERHGECRKHWNIACMKPHYTPELWASAGMEESEEEARQIGVQTTDVRFANLYERGDGATVTMIMSVRLGETGEIHILRLNQDWRRTARRWQLVSEEPADLR